MENKKDVTKYGIFDVVDVSPIGLYSRHLRPKYSEEQKEFIDKYELRPNPMSLMVDNTVEFFFDVKYISEVINFVGSFHNMYMGGVSDVCPHGSIAISISKDNNRYIPQDVTIAKTYTIPPSDYSPHSMYDILLAGKKLELHPISKTCPSDFDGDRLRIDDITLPGESRRLQPGELFIPPRHPGIMSGVKTIRMEILKDRKGGSTRMVLQNGLGCIFTEEGIFLSTEYEEEEYRD